jgi:bacteriophage HK97-gp10 putative tail-component
MIVTLNPEGLNRLLRDPTGPVMLNMRRRGENVLRAAQALCPSYLGDLRASLRVSVVSHLGQSAVEVGSNERYALYVEEGTGPAHEPDPHAPYFPPFNKPGFTLWAADHHWDPFSLAVHIYHHGTRPTHFLRNALPRAASAA